MTPLTLLIGLVSLGTARVPAKKPVIAVAVIGEAPQSTFDSLAPILAKTFDADIIAAPHIDLPSSAWNPSRRQYASAKLLAAMATMKHREWAKLLGIADVDLYAPDLNFVFGETDQNRGVAVFSLARLREGADEALFARRTATEAIHELGHAYGLNHCDKPTCVMWFSNSLSESDRKGTQFCPQHLEELQENRGR